MKFRFSAGIDKQAILFSKTISLNELNSAEN